LPRPRVELVTFCDREITRLSKPDLEASKLLLLSSPHRSASAGFNISNFLLDSRYRFAFKMSLWFPDLNHVLVDRESLSRLTGNFFNHRSQANQNPRVYWDILRGLSVLMDLAGKERSRSYGCFRMCIPKHSSSYSVFSQFPAFLTFFFLMPWFIVQYATSSARASLGDDR
jgi:hypothetical protein